MLLAAVTPRRLAGEETIVEITPMIGAGAGRIDGERLHGVDRFVCVSAMTASTYVMTLRTSCQTWRPRSGRRRGSSAWVARYPPIVAARRAREKLRSGGTSHPR